MEFISNLILFFSLPKFYMDQKYKTSSNPTLHFFQNNYLMIIYKTLPGSISCPKEGWSFPETS